MMSSARAVTSSTQRTKNEINRKLDVAISADKIARVSPQIDALPARKVVDCSD